jgi:hypothetical protein
LSIIEKAEEQVLTTGSHVFNALSKVKFVLVTVPIICVAVGILAQQVIKERNVATGKIKIGSFATPANPQPIPLASETQLVARLRAGSIKLQDKYPDALMVTSTIDGDVVTITVTAQSPERTEAYLLDVANQEIDFQNTRLEKLQAVQLKRKTSLEAQVAGFQKRVADLELSIQQGGGSADSLARQQELKSTRDRIAGIRLELNALALLNASDLFIDTTQVIQAPIIIASSNWYRPILYGAAGLAVGLILTFVIAISAIILSISRRKKEPDKEVS